MYFNKLQKMFAFKILVHLSTWDISISLKISEAALWFYIMS